MEIEFASGATAHEDFVRGIGISLALLAATLLVAAFGRGFGARATGRSFRSIVIAILAISVVAGALVCERTYARFTSLTSGNNVLTLHFPAPFERTLDIPKSDVKEVLFGLPDKGGQVCHLRITTRSADVYVSADTMLEAAACKEVRERVQASIQEES